MLSAIMIYSGAVKFIVNSTSNISTSTPLIISISAAIAIFTVLFTVKFVGLKGHRS